LPAFLGLPLFHGGELVGMVGLANAAKGYEQSLIDELEPMLVICDAARLYPGIPSAQCHGQLLLVAA
jgi:hypothetical protein